MKECDEIVGTIKKTLEKCPWVQEQTLESLKHEIVSEAHEVVQAIEKKDYQNLKEELGDIIYDALLLAVIAEKEGHFTIPEVFSTVNEKIIRRKPWVFGDMVVKDSVDAVRMWNVIKKQEKEEKARKKALTNP